MISKPLTKGAMPMLLVVALSSNAIAAERTPARRCAELTGAMAANEARAKPLVEAGKSCTLRTAETDLYFDKKVAINWEAQPARYVTKLSRDGRTATTRYVPASKAWTEYRMERSRLSNHDVYLRYAPEQRAKIDSLTPAQRDYLLSSDSFYSCRTVFDGVEAVLAIAEGKALENEGKSCRQYFNTLTGKTRFITHAEVDDLEAEERFVKVFETWPIEKQQEYNRYSILYNVPLHRVEEYERARRQKANSK